VPAWFWAAAAVDALVGADRWRDRVQPLVRRRAALVARRRLSTQWYSTPAWTVVQLGWVSSSASVPWASPPATWLRGRLAIEPLADPEPLRRPSLDRAAPDRHQQRIARDPEQPRGRRAARAVGEAAADEARLC
jgi:hypothetical protein